VTRDCVTRDTRTHFHFPNFFVMPHPPAGYSVYGSTVSGNVLFFMPDDIWKRFSTGLLFLHVCVSYVMAQQVVGRAIHVRSTSLHSKFLKFGHNVWLLCHLHCVVLVAGSRAPQVC